MTELDDQENVAQLQSALVKKEQEAMAIRSVMRTQLVEIERQLADLKEQNARLQTFSDAVRNTFVYRFYRKFLRPLGINVW